MEVDRAGPAEPDVSLFNRMKKERRRGMSKSVDWNKLKWIVDTVGGGWSSRDGQKAGRQLQGVHVDGVAGMFPCQELESNCARVDIWAG